jgi:hypothetical protein
MPRIARGEAAAIGDLPQGPVDLPQPAAPDIHVSIPDRGC